MNAATRDTIEALVAAAPETLPASIVALTPRDRENLLVQVEWEARKSSDDLTAAQLATRAARRLDESRAQADERSRDEEIADRAVAAVLGRF